MDAFYEQTIEIKTYDLDMNKKLKLSALFNYFQEAATNHAHRLGAGDSNNKMFNYYWVLSRMKVVIKRLPEWHEQVIIRTWAKSMDKLFFIRDFEVLTENKEEMIKATSYWVLIDANRMKTIPAKKAPFQIPVMGTHAINESLEKIQPPTEVEYLYEVPIGYSQIDINQHMNNAKYLDLLMNGVDKGYLDRQITSLQINYIAETKLGELMKLNRYIENDRIYIEGVHSGTNKRSFNTELIFGTND